VKKFIPLFFFLVHFYLLCSATRVIGERTVLHRESFLGSEAIGFLGASGSNKHLLSLARIFVTFHYFNALHANTYDFLYRSHCSLYQMARHIKPLDISC
jgi:hypothetical protein